MFGNNMVTILSLSGIVILTLGTVLGIIGMATSDWISFRSVNAMNGEAINVNVSGEFWLENFESTELDMMLGDVNTSEISCRVGLWQMCCNPSLDVEECQVDVRQVDTEIQVLRILMIISLIWLIASVMFLLVFSFKEHCHSKLETKQLLMFLLTTGVLMFLMVTISYPLYEYTKATGFFAQDFVAGFEWSFIVALVGALLNPLGTWLICTQWHFTEDKEAGVKFNYDVKTPPSTNSTFDTYI